jgi:hypothetical protein
MNEETQPTKIKLEVGKTYVNRRGELVFVKTKLEPLVFERDSGSHAHFRALSPHGAEYRPREPRVKSGSPYDYQGVTDCGEVDYHSDGRRSFCRSLDGDIVSESTEGYYDNMEERLKTRIQRLASENEKLQEQIDTLVFMQTPH